MILARIFSRIYKEGGIILIDANGQKYICGSPRKDKPITLKLLKDNLQWKLLIDPELEFPEAYMRNEIIIENASLKDFLIMPPAYYKGNTDEGVLDFYSGIIKSAPKIKIIL